MSLVALQTSDVTVAWTRDLWQLGGGQVETVRYRKGLTILEALARAIPADVLREFTGSDCIVTLNGEVRGRELWGMPLFGGDHLTWRPVMAFPAAPIAGAGLGAIAGAGGAAAGGSFLTGFLTLLGVSLLGTAASVAVQMLLAPTPPRKQRGDESSPTSSWRGVQVSFGAGQPIPSGFGQHMVAGQVIAAFREATSLASVNQPLAVGTDTLNILVSLGYGPHHDLGGYFPPNGEDQFDEEPASIFPSGFVMIDDQPLNTDTYPNARFWWRNGQELQTPIPGFSNIRTEYPVGLEFRVPPTPQQTRLVAVPIFFVQGVILLVESTLGFFVEDECIIDPGGPNQTTRSIQIVSPNSIASTLTRGTSPATQPTLFVDDVTGFSVGEMVDINAGQPTAERHLIQAINPIGPAIVLQTNLGFSHGAGQPVTRAVQMRVIGGSIVVPSNAIVVRIGKPGQRVILYQSTAESTQLSRQPSVTPGIVVRIEMDACYRLIGSNISTFTVEFEISERLEGTTLWSNPQSFFLVYKKTEPFPVDLKYTNARLREAGKKLELRIERKTPVDDTINALTNTVTNAQVASVLESIVTTYTVGGPNPVTRTDEHRYPFHALVAMRLPAIEQFSGSRPPTIKFKTKLLWCPDVTFSGTYNFIPWQQLSRADRWSNNPARACLAALTDELWGVGDVYTSAQLNLREFFRWKTYSSQSVSDGQGGNRPRFTFDANFDDLQSRQDALGAICAAGRCVLVEVGGLVTPIFAHPDDPGAGLPLPITGVYTETNIIGFIRRQYLPVNNPPDVINCEYQNAARGYDRDLQPVRDPKARRRPYRLRGINNKPETLNLVGCTSTAQAVSEGRYRHNVLRLIEHRYEFMVGRDSVQSVPGQRIATSHSAFRWFGEGTVLTNVARNSGPSYPPTDILRVVDARNFAVGDRIQVDPPGVAELYEVQSIDLVANELNLTSALLTDHTAVGAHKVVNLGLGANGTVNATCGSGTADPAVLRTTLIYGIRPGDEVWINPGGVRDERHWVEEVVGPGEYRLRNAMGFQHTLAQADLVRCLSFATYTGRAVDAGVATDTVAIDQPVDVPTTPAFTAIAVRQKDGTVKQARITDPPGTYAAGFLFTAPGLASTHNADAPVALGIEFRMLQEMRVAEVRQNPDLTFTIVAVDYNEEVFDDSPDGFVEPAPDAGSPGYGADSMDAVDAMHSVLAAQRPSTVPDGTGALDVSWSKTAERAAGSVVVWYREQGGQNTTWRRAGSSKTGKLIIDGLDQGTTYEVTAVPEAADQLGFVEPAAGSVSVVTIYERGARRIGGV